MLSLLAYITWTASPTIAEFGPWHLGGLALGPLTLRWYGLLFMSGFVLGTFVLAHIYKSERVSPQWVDVITIYMLIGTIVGARLGHVLFYDPGYYLTSEHFIEIFKIWEGGLASHGATLGILLATWLFSPQQQVRLPLGARPHRDSSRPGWGADSAGQPVQLRDYRQGDRRAVGLQVRPLQRNPPRNDQHPQRAAPPHADLRVAVLRVPARAALRHVEPHP